MAHNMRIADIPKAKGKQLSSPKQWTFSLNIGVMAVEIKDPKLITKKNNEKYEINIFCCCGRVN